MMIIIITIIHKCVTCTELRILELEVWVLDFDLLNMVKM